MRELAKPPIALRIDLKKVGEKEWSIEYFEECDPKDHAALIRSIELLKKGLPDISITKVTENGMLLKMVGSQAEIFGFLAGEFMVLSPIGTMRFKDLLVAAVNFGKGD